MKFLTNATCEEEPSFNFRWGDDTTLWIQKYHNSSGLQGIMIAKYFVIPEAHMY